MKQFLKTAVFSSVLLAGSFATVSALQHTPAYAQAPAPAQNSFKNQITDGSRATGTNTNASVEDGLKQVVNILLFLIGAVSVIVIIVGGLMYVVSAGDSGRTKKAKDTIMYAVIGLVVALFAFAIVNFVVRQF